MNKIIYTLLAIISFAGISSNANAFGSMGDRSCGKWITEKERSSIKSTSVDNISWLTGFLSGLSLGFKDDVLKGVDGNSLVVWTDNYCRTNPLKNISDAGIDLYLELSDKKRLK